MMDTMKKRPLLQLYKKEIYTKRLEIIGILACVLLWNVLVIIKPWWFTYRKEDVVGISMSLPAGIIFVWTIWIGFKSISYEWDNNTCYLLLSLPISGFKVLTVKILSILSILLVFIVEVCGAALVVDLMKRSDSIHIDIPSFGACMAFIADIFLVLLYMLVSAAIMVILCQFAYIASRLVNRFSKVFAVVAGGAGLWVFMRGTSILTYLLNLLHLPKIKILIGEGDGFISLSPIIATLLLSFGLLYVTAKLFDHVVEV